MHIQILKWSKHNPRTDYKSIPWFKLASGFYRDRKLHGLSLEAKWVCLCLFCLAAEQNEAGAVDGDADWIADQIKLPPEAVTTAIEALANRGIIAVTYAGRTEPFVSRSLDNEDNEDNEGGIPPVGGHSDFDLSTSESWLTWAKSVTPSIKAKPADWATAIRRMREVDGLSEDEVTALFAFIRDDPFWRTNALSPVALRQQKSKNGLKKLENVRLSMERAKPVRPMHLNPIIGEAP